MTHHAQQPAIQVWLDMLSPVERHLARRLLNEYGWEDLPLPEYDMSFLYRLRDMVTSTAPGGQEIARR